MSSEIATSQTEPVGNPDIECPYCESSECVVQVYADGLILDYYYCNQCQIPFVAKVEIVQKVTTYKIEGLYPAGHPTTKCEMCGSQFDGDPRDVGRVCPDCIRKYEEAENKQESKELPTIDTDIVEDDTQKFIESLPLHTCIRCEKDFHAAVPCKLDGDVYCSDCFDEITHEEEEEECHGGTQPDEDRIHCKECGLLYPSEEYCHDYGMCKECAEHSDFKELAERVQNAAPDEQNEPEYIQLPGSRTVSYCIDEDTIKLQYKGNDCNAYTSDIVWDIVDTPQVDWMKRIDAMLEGETNFVQKASALNQLCKAVSKGTVKIPGGDD